MAKQTQNQQKRVFSRLQQETTELLNLEVSELLTEDMNTHLNSVTTLLVHYTSNCDLIQDLTEEVDPANVDAVVKGINSDMKTFRKVKKEVMRLHTIKDAYKGSISMKKLVSHLAEEDLLTGPACQEDLKTLRNYVVKFGSELVSLRCTEV